MNSALHWGLGALCLLLPTIPPLFWESAAHARYEEAQAAPKPEGQQAATAAASNEGYCSPELKKVLRRVLQSCGLLSTGEVRGCQPLEAKSVATLAGSDFNALFAPLKDRAGILQFDQSSADLDPADTALLDKLFADQRGASYFFVVSRASPEGSELVNRQISEARGKAALTHLQSAFNDPDLSKEVGLLWLGEEFAQLDDQFCQWQRSGAADSCSTQDLNRSAFVAWIDCQL